VQGRLSAGNYHPVYPLLLGINHFLKIKYRVGDIALTFRIAYLRVL
jgi:hypothetical protein